MWKKQPPDSSTKISKFYAPTDTEHKSNEKEIKTWLPINSVWDHFHWETYSTVLKSDNHHVALHQPLIEQKPITKVLIIYKHSTHTNYTTFLAVGLTGSSQTPGAEKWNLGFISLLYFTWLTPETKGKTLDPPSVLISFSYTWNKKLSACD